MSRFAILLLSILAFKSAAIAEKRNIILIVADDLGYHDLGLYQDSEFYEAPNLQELARTGMVFSRFYAASPVCSPTRVSVVSGKNPVRLETTNFFTGRRSGTFGPAPFANELPLEEQTLAETLKSNGYRTGFVGKWHLGEPPQQHGYDVNKGGGENGHPKSYFAPYKNVEGMANAPEGEFLTSRLANEGVSFMRQSVRQEKPFFLHYCPYSVHTPLQAPQKLIEKYEAKAKRLGIDDEDGSFSESVLRQVWPDTEKPRTVRIRQDHAVYAAMIESLDAAVGRILTEVDALGIRQSTAIVFTSDNGGLSTSEGLPTSNLPLRGGKGWMYEGGIRVPAIARVPGVTPPGTVCEAPVISHDLVPTVLELSDNELQPSQHTDAKSFLPVLRNPFVKFDRGPLYFHYPHYSNQGGVPASAIIDGDWKLIQDLEDGSLELFDLSTDHAEHNNLEQLNADKAQEMLQQLKSWRNATGAKQLSANPKTGDEPPVLW